MAVPLCSVLSSHFMLGHVGLRLFVAVWLGFVSLCQGLIGCVSFCFVKAVMVRSVLSCRAGFCWGWFC